MQLLIGLIGLFVLIAFSLRRWLLRRESPQVQAVDFESDRPAWPAAARRMPNRLSW